MLTVSPSSIPAGDFPGKLLSRPDHVQVAEYRTQLCNLFLLLLQKSSSFLKHHPLSSGFPTHLAGQSQPTNSGLWAQLWAASPGSLSILGL